MEFVARGKSDVHEILANPRIKAMMEDDTYSFRLLDLEGNYVVVSAGAHAITGYTPGEYVKLDSSKLTHPEDRPMIAEAMASIVNGPVEAIGRGVHKEGHTLWARARAMLLDNYIAVALEEMGEPPAEPSWRHIEPFL